MRTLTFGVFVLAASLLAGRWAIQMRAQEDDVASWNAEGAAAYLDERQEWWANWPRTTQEHGTFCVSCHTAAPYALARSALRAAWAEDAPAPAERKLLDSITRRVETWAEIGPYYSDE